MRDQHCKSWPRCGTHHDRSRKTDLMKRSMRRLRFFIPFHGNVQECTHPVCDVHTRTVSGWTCDKTACPFRAAVWQRCPSRPHRKRPGRVARAHRAGDAALATMPATAGRLARAAPRYPPRGRRAQEGRSPTVVAFQSMYLGPGAARTREAFASILLIHQRIHQRSISPNTTSKVPMIAATSANWWPLTM